MLKKIMLAAMLAAMLAILVAVGGCESDDPATADDACEAFLAACPTTASDEMSYYPEYFNVGWVQGCPAYLDRFFVYGGLDCLAATDTCVDVDDCYNNYYFC